MAGDGSRFEAGVEAWVAGLGGPRDAVRQELVRGQLAEVMAGRGVPQRVLDVGCGQGTQALLLARAGHEVVGLDPSADLLARFRAVLAGEPAQVRGRVRLVEGAGQQAPALAGAGFDVVLCHGVLMYLDDVAAMLTALTAAAAADGLVSLLVRNGMAPAMRPGLRGDWPAAIRAFDDPRYVNSLGLPATAHTPEALDGVLGPLGWRRHRWFGVRVFTDHVQSLEWVVPPQLLAAEREAGRRDPYRGVAALLHLIYARR